MKSTALQILARCFQGCRSRRSSEVLLGVVLAYGLSGCANVGVGVSLPIPGIGNIGVGVDSSGQVGGGVAVGTGGVSVGVGTSGRLPQAPAVPASAASASVR
jgi:hypothetical protein